MISLASQTLGRAFMLDVLVISLVTARAVRIGLSTGLKYFESLLLKLFCFVLVVRYLIVTEGRKNI